DLNGPHQRLREGCEALGWRFDTVVRNTDLSRYAPETAGYIGFGDQSGSKQSADKTWLLDAYRNEAEILVHTRAQRVLVEGGRAAGVEAVYVGADGTDQRAVTIRAPHVVVACGALESPALLLRSGVGGTAGTGGWRGMRTARPSRGTRLRTRTTCAARDTGSRPRRASTAPRAPRRSSRSRRACRGGATGTTSRRSSSAAGACRSAPVG